MDSKENISFLETKNKNLMNIFMEMQEDMKRSATRIDELTKELKKEYDNINNMSIVADCILARSKNVCTLLNQIHSGDETAVPINFFQYQPELVELTKK